MGCGDDLRDETTRIWDTSHPEISHILCEEIERNALPHLRTIVGLCDYLQAVSHHWARHRLYHDPKVRIVFDAAMGRFRDAQRQCDILLSDVRDIATIAPEVLKIEIAGARRLCSMVERGDQPAILEQLHAWEEHNVIKLKLTRHWERTPFPGEAT